MITRISEYIKSHPRNKIVFITKDLPDIKYVDIGKELSQVLFPLRGKKILPMKVFDSLENIFRTSIQTSDDRFGEYVAISNPGILFEPELKIDFGQFLSKWSANNTLFVKWEGDIDSGWLYFLSREKGIKTNIRNLSYITI